MIPKIEDVEIQTGHVMIEPLRTNSEIVRSEKKYDRHSFGKVLKLGINTDEGFLLGKNVFYDDTDAISGVVEVDGRPTQVEFVSRSSVTAYVTDDVEEEK